jgi:hypothetical protein
MSRRPPKEMAFTRETRRMPWGWRRENGQQIVRLGETIIEDGLTPSLLTCP